MRSTQTFPAIYTLFSCSERSELYLSAYEYSSWDLTSVKNKIAESWSLKAAEIGALSLTGSVFGNEGAASVTTQQEWNWVCSQIQGAVGEVVITPREAPEDMQAALVKETTNKLDQMTRERNKLQRLADEHTSKLSQQSSLVSAQTSEIQQLKNELQALTRKYNESDAVKANLVRERKSLQTQCDALTSESKERKALNKEQHLELEELTAKLHSLATKLEESEKAEELTIKQCEDYRLIAQALESTPVPDRNIQDTSPVEVLQYQVDSLATEFAALRLTVDTQAFAASDLRTPTSKSGESAQVAAAKNNKAMEPSTHSYEAMQLLCKTQTETFAMLKANNDSYLAQVAELTASIKATRESASFELDHLKMTSQVKLAQLQRLNEDLAQELNDRKAARAAEFSSSVQFSDVILNSLNEASQPQASFQDLRASYTARLSSPSIASSVSGFDLVEDDVGANSDDGYESS